MHTIKITPNLLFEYQCTSGKFITSPNRIESKKNRFGSDNRIESNRIFFPNWNALLGMPLDDRYSVYSQELDVASFKIDEATGRQSCRTNVRFACL